MNLNFVFDKLVSAIEEAPLSVEDEGVLNESSIDFPQTDLDSQVWDKRDGSYVLKQEVKQKIKDVVDTYNLLDLFKYTDEFHITGSIGTNQYEEDADIDVHLVVDPKTLPDTKTPDDWQKDVFKFFKDKRAEIGGFIGKHPIEVYLQFTPTQELLSDGCYDVNKEKWLKGPKIVDLDYDPYEVYKSIADDIKDFVGETDEIIADLKRDIIDYEVIKKAILRLPAEVQDKLKKHLEEKLGDIEVSVRDLMSQRKEWLDMRRDSSQPVTSDEALKDVELVKKWNDANAMFKFLSRYNYMRLIKELESVVRDDGKVTDKEVELIKHMVKSS